MLYLVKCEVQITYYMDETKTEDKIHIVEADSEQQAKDKVQDYYAKKDSAYSVSHWVNFEYVNESIS